MRIWGAFDMSNSVSVGLFTPLPLRERGRGRGRSFAQRLPNGFEHGIGVQEYVVVPEPEDAKPLSHQPGIACGVMRGLNVLPTIGLDDHSRSEMHEIYDARTDRLLAAELLPIESMRSQILPEPMLGVRHVAAKLLRERP